MAESNGFTLWFTGMSGAGKSTLAAYIGHRLRAADRFVEILDGDEIHEHLARGLGTSREDRETLSRRLGWLAGLLTRNGAIAIVASVSPYREVREQIRRDIGRFVEVFTDCDVNALIERDQKGLYKKALAGEIPNFTGITDPYEPPANCEVTIDSGSETVDVSAGRIMETLGQLGFLDEDELQVALFGRGKVAPSARKKIKKAATKSGSGARKSTAKEAGAGKDAKPSKKAAPKAAKAPKKAEAKAAKAAPSKKKATKAPKKAEAKAAKAPATKKKATKSPKPAAGKKATASPKPAAGKKAAKAPKKADAKAARPATKKTATKSPKPATKKKATKAPKKAAAPAAKAKTSKKAGGKKLSDVVSKKGGKSAKGTKKKTTSGSVTRPSRRAAKVATSRKSG